VVSRAVLSLLAIVGNSEVEHFYTFDIEAIRGVELMPSQANGCNKRLLGKTSL
jgi:hypothetical protein